MDAATYNRSTFGTGYTMADLPSGWAGTHLLSSFDTDGDLELSQLELAGVDWEAVSRSVSDFQASKGLSGGEVDGRLGPKTLRLLRESFPASMAAVALRMGDLALPAAEERLAPPPPNQIADGSGAPERAAVALLWNNYGGAVLAQAAETGVEPAVALAIFAVESKRAYDPTTGLVIVRFEPKVFLRRAGRLVTSDHTSQLVEWKALEQAYALDQRAALESASYGLPQLMGFNFEVTKHPDARSLLLAFQRSARDQVAGFFGFVAANDLVDAARERRFVDFARRYNGIGKEQLYGDKMARYYGIAREILG